MVIQLIAKKNIDIFVVIQLIAKNSYFCGYCSLAKLEIRVYIIILCKRGRERGHDLINYLYSFYVCNILIGGGGGLAQYLECWTHD